MAIAHVGAYTIGIGLRGTKPQLCKENRVLAEVIL